MHKVKYALQKIRPEEWLALLTFSFVAYVNTQVYRENITLASSVKQIVNYFTFGNPFLYLFSLVVLGVSLFIFYNKLSASMVDWVVRGVRPDRESALKFIAETIKPIRIILPLVLITAPISQLLTNFSYELRYRVVDVLLARADYVLTGHYFFIDLPNYFQATFFTWLMYFSYKSLTFIMCYTFIFLYFSNKSLLRLAVTAFIFSNIIAYPFFYLLPAQGPIYSLILNIRNIEVPEDVSVMIRPYRPTPYILDVTNGIMRVYVDKTHDNSAPVSSLPSMHATWAFIFIYILWRVRPWTIYLMVPWVFLMLSGGLYFSLHYFIDYVAAVPVSTLCIVFAKLLLRNEVVN